MPTDTDNDRDNDRPVLGLLPGADQPRLPGYEVVEPFSCMGLAQWWRATRGGREHRVAVIPVTGASREELLLQVDNANRLAHPGLRAPVATGSTLDDDALWFDFGPDPGPPLSTMSKLDPVEALGLARELTQAMLAFHALGRPLGDLRPEDITHVMGRVSFPAMPLAYSGRGLLPGGDARASVAADQVAIGVVLAGLLSGHWGALGDLEHVPTPLRSVVHRLVHPDPARRYPDLAAVAVELETERRQLMASGDATFVPTTVPRRRGAVGLLLLLFLGGVGLSGAGAGAWWWAGSRSGPPMQERELPAPIAAVAAPSEPAPPAPAAPPPAPDVKVTTPPSAAAVPAPAPAPAPVAAAAPEEPVQAEEAPTEPAIEAPAAQAPPPEPAAGEVLPEPEPTQPEVAAPTPPTPAPQPAPAGTDPAQLSGTYRGERSGRPLTLTLTLAADGSLSGVAAVQLGPSVREAKVTGTWSEGPQGIVVAFDEQGMPRPASYAGELGGGSLRGRWSEGGRDRGAFATSR